MYAYEMFNYSFAYSRYTTRCYCSILAKCRTCSDLLEVGKTLHANAERDALEQAQCLHRGGLFMLERNQYRKVIHRTNLPESSGKVLSIIIDKMDCNKSKIPYMADQKNLFSETIEQGITGVLRHGNFGQKNELTIYRTLETVGKTTNLTIYAICRTIERWRKANQYRNPEELYLQLDGGCENANGEVLAFLEYLVIKRICRLVVYTRLPVGHTHEDIDAMFGHIARHCRGIIMRTLGDFEREVRNAFDRSMIDVDLEDVYIVPDYVKWLDKCFTVGRLHKEELTQHQWRFEAVQTCPEFPFGVKTLYRAYASPRVIEFYKRNKGQCISRIGQLIGLEPVAVYSR